MADEPKPKVSKGEPKPKVKKVKEPEPEDTALVAAAKTIGAAAGKIASLAGVSEPPKAPSPSKVKPPKLQKKNKSRLPRKQKKALRKGLATPAR